MPEYLRVREDGDRWILEGFIDRNSYGIFHYCYSQPDDFLKNVLEDEVAEDYGHNLRHEQGQKTVDIVCFAIDALPNIEVIQTPSRSVADCCLRWDLILKWNKFNFPIQIKSAPTGISKATEDNLISKYAERRIDFLQDQARVGLNRTEYKEQINLYKKSMPLYIWADNRVTVVEKTIRSLVQLYIDTFKIVCNVKECQESAVKSYKDKYSDSGKRIGKRISLDRKTDLPDWLNF